MQLMQGNLIDVKVRDMVGRKLWTSVINFTFTTAITAETVIVSSSSTHWLDAANKQLFVFGSVLLLTLLVFY